ncbi:hypothetical protein Ancab_034891 [Ancistrocladus abbreviatus]
MCSEIRPTDLAPDVLRPGQSLHEHPRTRIEKISKDMPRRNMSYVSNRILWAEEKCFPAATIKVSGLVVDGVVLVMSNFVVSDNGEESQKHAENDRNNLKYQLGFLPLSIFPGLEPSNCYKLRALKQQNNPVLEGTLAWEVKFRFALA